MFLITWVGHHIPFSIVVLVPGAALGGLLHEARCRVAEPASPTSPGPAHVASSHSFACPPSVGEDI